jgi:hypothetical protein
MPGSGGRVGMGEGTLGWGEEAAAHRAGLLTLGATQSFSQASECPTHPGQLEVLLQSSDTCCLSGLVQS